MNCCVQCYPREFPRTTLSLLWSVGRVSLCGQRFIASDALDGPAHVYNVDWYKTSVLHSGRASFLSLLLFSGDNDLLSSCDVFLILARSLISFKMEKQISHFHSRAAKRARMGPRPSTPGGSRVASDPATRVIRSRISTCSPTTPPASCPRAPNGARSPGAGPCCTGAT